jgi:Rps23 Pro-64 3,4-dihydroxylase Tpa1-like proline 4-hydroxylase
MLSQQFNSVLSVSPGAARTEIAGEVVSRPETYSRLGIHNLTFCDDFSEFAVELRAELLRFSAWTEMRQQGDRSIAGLTNPARQNGLTTGHITAKHESALPNCLRFREQLQAFLPRLCSIMAAPFSEQLQIEMNAMAYGEGAWLSGHTDRGKTAAASDRLIAWMLYLTHPDDEEWPAERGGAVRLRDRAGHEAVLRPKFNRFAMFTVSNESFHEIERITWKTGWERSRLALSGWIRGPYVEVEKKMCVYLKSVDHERLRTGLETSLLGSIALYQLMNQQRSYCDLDTTKTEQLLQEYQRDYEAHSNAPDGTSFSHRSAGPAGCITVLNEDRTICFFGPSKNFR